jgi:hypothetical protein
MVRISVAASATVNIAHDTSGGGFQIARIRILEAAPGTEHLPHPDLEIVDESDGPTSFDVVAGDSVEVAVSFFPPNNAPTPVPWSGAEPELKRCWSDRAGGRSAASLAGRDSTSPAWTEGELPASRASPVHASRAARRGRPRWVNLPRPRRGQQVTPTHGGRLPAPTLPVFGYTTVGRRGVAYLRDTCNVCDRRDACDGAGTPSEPGRACLGCKRSPKLESRTPGADGVTFELITAAGFANPSRAHREEPRGGRLIRPTESRCT